MQNTEINYKYNIGQLIKTDSKEIIITNRKVEYVDAKNRKRKRMYKYYQYKCNKCGFDCGEHYKNGQLKDEYWIEESNFDKPNSMCVSCNGNVVVRGFNGIYDTHLYLSKMFKNKEESYKYTVGSGVKVDVICPSCNVEKNIRIDDLYKQGIGCACFSNGSTYPEKFLFFILKILGLDFKKEASKNTFSWISDKKRYDFYIPSLNMIIETHGIQHYEQTNRNGDKTRTLKEEQENDKLKRELALENGIEHYIELDCRKSDMEWIKNSIMNSKLDELFDLSKVDWDEIDNSSRFTNEAKIACEFKKNNPDYTTTEIGDIMGHANSTISNWLKLGTKQGWCEYNPKDESGKRGASVGRRVNVFDKEHNLLGTFKSTRELDRESENALGVKLHKSSIQNAIVKGYTHKGFILEYA